MADIINEIGRRLEAEDILLVVLPNSEFSKQRLDLTAALQKKGLAVCYVSANTPAKKLRVLLKGAGVVEEKLSIIDCITGGISAGVAGDASTVFVSSPKDLTGLSIAISQAVKGGSNCLLVDSVSTFVLYESPVSVARFAHSVISRLRVFDKKGVFLINKDESSRALYEDLRMLVDSVVDGGG